MATSSCWTSQPRVLVPACLREINGHPTFYVGRKYIDAVRLAGAQPWVVPGTTPDEIDTLLDDADGVLLTGSPSNVHPRHFDQPVLDATLPLDEPRDAWTLPLAQRALALGVPLLGICRGFQEINVALGGSLHQAVHERPGHDDHRAPDGAEPERRYAPAHLVHLTPGGQLATLPQADTILVNSLHGQGIARLAPGLAVEATAPDGLVEAFRVSGASAFALAVQWHPEWRAGDSADAVRLFGAFGAACREGRARSSS